MTTLRTDSTHSGITIDYANGSGFVHGGSGPLTVYSDDEKAAINALTDANDDTYYLFLVKNVTKLDADGNRTIVSGYMPVGYQHGFIFEQFDVARTIAHELSHGAFALHHTFSANTESFHADEGTTTNLMDYTEHGIALNHKQWRWMHEKHGSGLFGFLADEEEGEGVREVVSQITDYEYLYIKQCSTQYDNEINRTETTYKVIGKKISGDDLVIEPKLDINKGNLFVDLEGDATIVIFDNGKPIHLCNPDPPIDVNICNIDRLDDSQNELKEKIKSAAQNCKSLYLTEILQKLNAISLSQSVVEYTLNNNSYRLINGQIKESSLSDDDINNGLWPEVDIEYITRLYRDGDGIFQIKAFGFHKDLPIAKGTDWDGNVIRHTANLPELASDIKVTANKYLKQNKVTKIEQNPEITTQADVFPGNQTIDIDDKSSCLGLLMKGVDIANKFLKNAEFEQEIYLSNSKAPIKLPAIATGTTESVARSLTDITSLVGFAYDMIFDDDARHSTVDGLKTIKDQVVEDPSMLFPLLWEVVLEEVTGATSDQYAELSDESIDEGRKKHLRSKIAVRTTASIFTASKIIPKLPEMSFELARKISLAKGFKRFDLREAQDIYKTFFDDFNLADPSIKKKFLDNPDYVDAWIFFKQYDVDASLRQNFGAMDAFLAKKRVGKEIKEIPAPETYLSKEFIARHLAKFDDGAAFIFTKLDVESSDFTSFNPNKFVMPKSDIKKIVKKYQETGNRKHRNLRRRFGV